MKPHFKAKLSDWTGREGFYLHPDCWPQYKDLKEFEKTGLCDMLLHWDFWREGIQIELKEKKRQKSS